MTREEIARVIRNKCAFARADIAQDIDGAEDAADAMLKLLRGEG